ncbi:MAG TPA: sugar phosphate isomerase/epimerase [Fimbriimonadaceae bacterium]|nr:sugar phosphate isomerase/epimerase [Fimbriimonadaceae bacterium]
MRLSVQLYTVRDSLANDISETLNSIRDIGLEYVELAGYSGLSPEKFQSQLLAAGLQVSGGHWGLDQLKDVEAVCEQARLFGLKHIILPWVGEDSYQGGWLEFGKELEPLARAYSDRGFTFSYHNHAFEFKAGPGSTYEEMWAGTESVLQAQLDLGWVAYSSQDPVEWLNRLGSRCPTVHLKDFSGNADSHDAIAGTGILDWNAILRATQANGTEFGVIEMDRPPGDPVESVKECFDFFHSKGLG